MLSDLAFDLWEAVNANLVLVVLPIPEQDRVLSTQNDMKSVDNSFAFFQTRILRHAIERSPHSIYVFSRDDVLATIEFITDTYVSFSCVWPQSLTLFPTEADWKAHWLDLLPMPVCRYYRNFRLYRSIFTKEESMVLLQRLPFNLECVPVVRPLSEGILLRTVWCWLNSFAIAFVRCLCKCNHESNSCRVVILIVAPVHRRVRY